MYSGPFHQVHRKITNLETKKWNNNDMVGSKQWTPLSCVNVGEF